MPGSNLIEIESVSQWNGALRQGTATGSTVFVDFHATWCGPCKQISPMYTQLADGFPQSTFLRVDVDKLQPIAQKYKVTAMPTFLAIKQGQVVDTLKGADMRGLAQLIQAHAGPNPPVAPLSATAEQAKSEGNAAFKEGRWQDAIDAYSRAIEAAPEAAQLYGNRSIAYLKLTPPDATAALADAEKATTLQPAWGKGHVRLGEALLAIGGRDDEARAAFEQGAKTSEGTVKKQAEEKAAALRR